MRRNTFLVVMLALRLCSAALAGDIEGKVTGMKGKSVVYIEAIANSQPNSGRVPGQAEMI